MNKLDFHTPQQWNLARSSHQPQVDSVFNQVFFSVDYIEISFLVKQKWEVGSGCSEQLRGSRGGGQKDEFTVITVNNGGRLEISITAAAVLSGVGGVSTLQKPKENKEIKRAQKAFLGFYLN